MKLSYNTENKLSFENYIYYKMMIHKNKRQTAIWYVAELLYLYCVAITEPNITGHIFLVPVFILVLVKDIIFVVGKKRNRAVISLIVNLIAFMSMVAETGLFSGPSGMTDVLIMNCSIAFPLLFCFIMYKNDLITEALSEMPDYPAFREDFYRVNDEPPFETFDDSRKDIFLKKSLEQFHTDNRTELLKVIVLGCSAVSLLFMMFFTVSLIKAQNAEDYDPLADYSIGKYVRMNISDYIDGEHRENFFGNTSVGYWCRTNDKYVYVKSSVKDFDKIKKLSAPQEYVFKTCKLDSDNTNIFRSIVNKEGDGYSENKCEKNVYFKMTDPEITGDKILRYLMFALAGLAAYIIIGLVKPNRNS